MAVNELGIRSSLAACPLFADLAADDEAMSRLAGISTITPAAAGSTVIREGSDGDGLYVIVSGRVRVEKLTPYGDPYTVLFQETGAYFGELSLLDRDIRSATVIAETACEFLVIERQRFFEFGHILPSAALLVTRRVAERLAQRLRQSTQDVVTLFSALVDEIESRL